VQFGDTRSPLQMEQLVPFEQVKHLKRQCEQFIDIPSSYKPSAHKHEGTGVRSPLH
jgi:hypothetical protein